MSKFITHPHFVGIVLALRSEAFAELCGDETQTRSEYWKWALVDIRKNREESMKRAKEAWTDPRFDIQGEAVTVWEQWIEAQAKEKESIERMQRETEMLRIRNNLLEEQMRAQQLEIAQQELRRQKNLRILKEIRRLQAEKDQRQRPQYTDGPIAMEEEETIRVL